MITDEEWSRARRILQDPPSRTLYSNGKTIECGGIRFAAREFSERTDEEIRYKARNGVYPRRGILAWIERLFS